MDKYGYIGIETLLNFCENSKDHSVTPNDFMRMKRVRMPERKKGRKIIYCKDCKYHRQNDYGDSWCAHSKGLNEFDLKSTDFCSRGKRRTDETN